MKESASKTKKNSSVKKKTVSSIKKDSIKKPKADKKTVVDKTEEKDSKLPRYFRAVGRRKTSVAVVKIFTQGGKELLINNKPYKEYFPTLELQQIMLSPLEKMNCIDKFKIAVNLKGGGMHSQAEALRHGLSRALILFNQTFRKRLKKAGYLTRDPRMRERKKFGLKRARRAPQWSKR